MPHWMPCSAQVFGKSPSGPAHPRRAESAARLSGGARPAIDDVAAAVALHATVEAESAHVFGQQPQPPPQTLGWPKPPQSCPPGHVPQSRVPPHPSPAAPQLKPSSAQVSGVQAPTPFTHKPGPGGRCRSRGCGRSRPAWCRTAPLESKHEVDGAQPPAPPPALAVTVLAAQGPRAGTRVRAAQRQDAPRAGAAGAAWPRSCRRRRSGRTRQSRRGAVGMQKIATHRRPSYARGRLAGSQPRHREPRRIRAYRAYATPCAPPPGSPSPRLRRHVGVATTIAVVRRRRPEAAGSCTSSAQWGGAAGRRADSTGMGTVSAGALGHVWPSIAACATTWTTVPVAMLCPSESTTLAGRLWQGRMA